MSTTEIDPASFTVPVELKPVLEEYLREVLRFQPDDIPAFSRDFFAAKVDGRLEVFLAGQKDKMVERSGPGNGGFRSLHDYSLAAAGSTARRNVQPASQADEDPTEREIREMRGRHPGPDRMGVSGSSSSSSSSSSYAAAAGTADEYDYSTATDHVDAAGAGASPRQKSISKGLIDATARATAAAGGTASFRVRGGVHGSISLGETHDEDEIIQMQERLRAMEGSG